LLNQYLLHRSLKEALKNIFDRKPLRSNYAAVLLICSGKLKHNRVRNICTPIYIKQKRKSNEISNFALFHIMSFVDIWKICICTRLPCVTEIVRPLDQHNGWPKRFERDDQMSKMKFGFEIQLNGHVFHTVLRLPPLGRRTAIHIIIVNIYYLNIYN